MRALKVVGIAAGAVVAMLALVLVALWLFVDPNDYKERIAAAVRQSTGRSLSLRGELKLSVFPWIRIQTGEASLGNPAGFGDEPFLTLQRASLSVKLLPLLKKQLQIGRIEIDGLDLRLKQNAAGKGNWEEWGAGGATDAADDESAGRGSLELAGIRIVDSRIGFEDMLAERVNLDIGRVAPGAAIPVQISLQLIAAAGASPLPLAAKFGLELDLDRQRYRLAGLALSGSVPPAGTHGVLDWKVTMPAADLDLAAQTLANTAFTAEVGAAKLTGSIAGTQLIDAPNLSGRFELAQLAPRALMQQFGMTPPSTRDSGVLAKFAAQGSYAWQNKVARLDELKLRLDESALVGRLAYDTSNSAMDFALALDHIDLDRYQPPPTNPQAASAPIELPVDFLKPLRAKGAFTVGEIRIGGALLTRLSAGIDVQDAVARFAPLRAQLYGGQYNGQIALDMRPAQPRLTMDEHLDGIDIARFMKDYMDSERLSGKGRLDVKLAATGRSGDALLRTLSGTISTDLAGGAVEGIDLWHAIAQAQSLIQQRQLATVSNTHRTAFDTFRVSADVLNGVATTDDLAIGSQLLRIAGAGTINLVTQGLDYNVTATVLKTPPGADAGTEQLARAVIPVKITGTLADPKIRPDLAGMAKERVKQEVDRKKDEVKEKLKEKVQGTLKGLFGR